MLHSFANIFVFLATSEFINRETKHTERNLYFNHVEMFWDMTNKLRETLVSIQNINPEKQAQRLFSFVLMLFLVKKQVLNCL